MAFEAQIDTALRLIAANGATFTLRKLAPGSPSDPSKPWRPGPDVPTTHSVTAVVLPAGAGPQLSQFDHVAEEASLTQGEHRFLLVAAKGLSADIRPHDVIDGVDSGDGWEVVGSTVLAPNGERIIWEVAVQR